MAEKLIFPEEQTSDGFATSQINIHSRGNAEPVIRELLQNCLDARHRDTDSVDVVFTIDMVATKDIPAWKDYLDAFESARRQRRQHSQFSQNDERICERIDKAKGETKIPVLFCRDNGIGIDGNTMNRLLSEGNTDKSEKGAGSVGLGHLTAFAASDLRYVVYGGKTDSGFTGSGRAILAAHMGGGGRNGPLSAKGTLALGARQQLDLFDSSVEYLTKPPKILSKEFKNVSGTGTVVAILGFNFFGDNPDYATNRILKVSASHFLPAILNQRMTVTIDNRLAEADSHIRGDHRNIMDFLDPSGAVARRKNISFPEGLAYRAYRTIDQGTELKHDMGAKIKIRPLDANERNTRVNIFREGMWITWEAHNLEPSNFAGYKQFDAVILPDPKNSPDELYKLMRSSEGTDHMDIDLNNLNNKERKKLQGLLSKICDLLKKEVGKAAGESFIPRFAYLTFGSVHKAERLPSTTRTRTRTGRRRGKGKRGGGTNSGGGGAKRGRPAEIPLSAREIIEGEQVIGFDCYIEKHNYPKLGVRVLRETGSDETCDQLVPNSFLEIEAGSGTQPISSDPYEVEKRDSGKFTVKLKEPFQLGEGVLTVDLVARK